MKIHPQHENFEINHLMDRVQMFIISFQLQTSCQTNQTLLFSQKNHVYFPTLMNTVFSEQHNGDDN